MSHALRITVVAAALAAASLHAQEKTPNARWYVGNYGNEILVWDEASETVVERIPVRNPLPARLSLSADRQRLYVTDATMEKVEVVDLAAKRSVDAFTLTGGNVKVRISGFEAHPTGGSAVLLVKRYTRLPDRWQVEGPFMVRYDLAAKQVTDTIPWPGGQERDRVSFMFSPDGELLYLFADDLIALDAETFEEVDRWKISKPLEPGLAPMGLPFPRDPYQERGVFTGLFRMTDPVQNRRLMGVARVRLSEKEVDFFTLGPAEPVGFVLAPGADKAFGLFTQVGRYEFWEFDLEGRAVTRRVPFEGRPRMALMPSADGRRVFVYNAGNTIDVHDATTFERLRTVELGVDMIGVVVVPER